MTENPPLAPRDLALRVALFAGLVYLAGLLSGMVPIEGSLPRSVLYVFVAGALANAVCVRAFEHGRLSDFGLDPSLAGMPDLLYGLAFGAVAAIAVVAALLALGWDKFQTAPTGSIGSALTTAALLLFGAVGEEMIFRGYAFQLLTRQIGVFATILPSAVIFGLLHLSNQSSTLLAVLNTMLWGALLGYACVRTGSLWMPIGIHFGWNVLLPLAGANLSGFTIRVVGYALSPAAEGFRSGGAYGPEGSVLTTGAGVGLFWLVSRLTAQRDGSEKSHAQEGEVA